MGPPLLLVFALWPGLQEPEEILEVQMRAEEDYRAGRYRRALHRLEDLWERYPQGSEGWAACRSRRREWFLGRPACYSALLQLTECARWRVESGVEEPVPEDAAVAVWTVVLAGAAEGEEPHSPTELSAGEGHPVRHELDARLLEEGHPVIEESTWLFREFVLAMTGGRLAMRMRVLPLPELTLPVVTRADPMRFAGLAPGALARVWEALPPEVLEGTDWWWILYPSHVPERYPGFESMEFITGGMAVGPDGASPCFLIDDRWLLRKPPHLGQGPWSSEERRAYLPQWLLHEFAHHLFRSWPEFGLEKRDHQWFDRSTWPEDFRGRFEPDYYFEALHKRLQPRADPPLHVGLRYRPPGPEVWSHVDLEALPGAYERQPVQNPWHRGRILREETEDGSLRFRWLNEAGVSWSLEPVPGRGELRTGPGNPYRAAGNDRFRIALKRGPDGDWLPVIQGFRFGGELYRRLP